MSNCVIVHSCWLLQGPSCVSAPVGLLTAVGAALSACQLPLSAQCRLSAAVVNPRSAGRLLGLYSMLEVIGAGVRTNLSLAFQEVTAATSTAAVQSARHVMSDCFRASYYAQYSSVTLSAKARSPQLAAGWGLGVQAGFGLTDSR